MQQLRVFSYGGGVQSTAALVLSAQVKHARQELESADPRRWIDLKESPHVESLASVMARAQMSMYQVFDVIDFPIFLFCNVGDDSEHPDTLRYVNEIAIPYAQSQGVELIELRYTRRDGRQPTLYGEVMGDNRSIDIPMYLSGGSPGNRNCTKTFKVKVVDRWIKAHGASSETPAIIGLGISLDEYQRMRTDNPRELFKHKAYPLIDLWLTRQDCMNIIDRAGLPIPPKSSCWFCPYHSLKQWRRLKEHTPDLFAAAVDLEHKVNEKRARLGRDEMRLCYNLIPLEKAIQHSQLDMFDGDACESGFCMT